MKQKVVVKVFLPNPRTHGPPIHQTEYLYGEIKSEYEYDRAYRQVLIYVTSIRPDQTSGNSARKQLIGEINVNHRKYVQKDVAKDYVWLEYDTDAPDIVRLKNICLPVSAPDPEYQFKVQIILYDPKTFLKLSRDVEGAQRNPAVLDPIAHLIELLRHSEIPNKPPHTAWCHRLQHFLLLILMTINRVLLHKLLRVNESAFLRHFSIWLDSIKLFTFKRLVTRPIRSPNQFLIYILVFACSGRAWTIVFDVTFGMILMLILLRVSDPGEYLMKFTEVSQPAWVPTQSIMIFHSSQFIVRQLQQLLESLKGSPVGFKLNIELNNFFLQCFRYHVDLWVRENMSLSHKAHSINHSILFDIFRDCF